MHNGEEGVVNVKRARNERSVQPKTNYERRDGRDGLRFSFPARYVAWIRGQKRGGGALRGRAISCIFPHRLAFFFFWICKRPVWVRRRATEYRAHAVWAAVGWVRGFGAFWQGPGWGGGGVMSVLPHEVGRKVLWLVGRGGRMGQKREGMEEARGGGGGREGWGEGRGGEMYHND